MTVLARLVVVASTVTVPVALLAACDDTTTVVDCVVGTHHPPGRHDVCVADAIPPATMARLRAAARSAAQDNGGVARRVVVVETSRSSMGRALGATVAGPDALVWVVEVGGSFRCGRECFGSPPGAAPTGTAIVEDLVVSTLTVSDFSLQRHWIDLSHLGSVHVLR